jgi:magnesium transporter
MNPVKKTRIPIRPTVRKKGLPPGSLVYTGNRSKEAIDIRYHTFSEDQWSKDTDLGNVMEKLNKTLPEAAWLEVNGLSDLGPMPVLLNALKLDSLLAEDILNTNQNSKAEIKNNIIFLILKNIDWNHSDYSWDSEQISLVLKPNLVVSFAEKESSLLDPIYQRLDNPASKLRTHGSDYMFYAITDLIVDGYLETCEELNACLDELEIKLDTQQGFDPTSVIHQIKKFLIYFRHQVVPVKDAIARLVKDSGGLVSSDDYPYYQDILDHTNQIISQIDQIRENLNGVMELYLAQLTFRMNKIIQLLTLVSTIFMPLTLITGIYGMNFINMPGIEWKYGFMAVMALMVLIGIGFYLYYRRQKWL